MTLIQEMVSKYFNKSSLISKSEEQEIQRGRLPLTQQVGDLKNYLSPVDLGAWTLSILHVTQLHCLLSADTSAPSLSPASSLRPQISHPQGQIEGFDL